MKRLRFIPLLLVLVFALAACLPGLGTMESVNVSVESPHIAVATFTPAVAVTDVIVNFAGGDIDHVRTEDPRWQCQPYRNAWDCFVVGQDDPGPPRVVHPAGEPIVFIVYASEAGAVVASVYWKPR